MLVSRSLTPDSDVVSRHRKRQTFWKKYIWSRHSHAITTVIFSHLLFSFVLDSLVKKYREREDKTEWHSCVTLTGIKKKKPQPYGFIYYLSIWQCVFNFFSSRHRKQNKKKNKYDWVNINEAHYSLFVRKSRANKRK
jgi:hypothetical protein